MRGDGDNAGRVLVAIELRAQSKTETVYYVCRLQSYKDDLFAAMKHMTRRHEIIRSMSVKRLENEIVFMGEATP